MATVEDQEKLIELLKFTPRTYKIRLWGYGGEYVMGTVDRKIYDYFKRRRLDLSDFAWNDEYAEDQKIPEEMYPFYPGSWHDCDNVGHCWGVDRSAGTLQVEDENGNVVYEVRLENINGFGEDDENPDPEWCCDEEIWVDMKDPGTVVFVATSSEKGTFFEGDLELKAPFNPGKITLSYDDIDGNEIITKVIYNGEDVDNSGGDTNGKGSDFGFYIAGSNKHDGKGYEKYTNMDDIKYEMTEWFPKKINPVREGVYMVKTAGKNSYTYQCKWTGSKWVSSYVEPQDYDKADSIKIKEWQGLAADPDYVDETLTRWPYVEEKIDTSSLTTAFNEFNFEQSVAELEKMVNELGMQVGAEQSVACFSCGAEHLESELPELDGQLHCPDCKEGWVMLEDREEAKETTQPQTGWPFPGPAPTVEDTATEESKSKWWTVRTHYKKSCEQHEYFVQSTGTGRIKVVDGFRSCTYSVETNDGEFPQFEFTTVPGGNGDKDSLDMNSIDGSNIESSELVEMFDGGCWGDNEITGIDNNAEVERLKEFLSENGSYALEDEGEWYLDETEVWVWGPLEVEDDEGNVRIVIADENGNMIDFKED